MSLKAILYCDFEVKKETKNPQENRLYSYHKY